ncbi:MAG: hypothetical protein EYC70_17255 [Planctomycetota bacterium]|nr:MAG: hypothetical protein EYC70_17255 [Planctomycetota bacterium]
MLRAASALPLAAPPAQEKRAKQGVAKHVGAARCRSCHKPESPSYNEFSSDERILEIRHLHPNRTEPRVKTSQEMKTAGGQAAGRRKRP